MTKTCPYCKVPFEGDEDKTYCSAGCSRAMASGGDSMRLRRTDAAIRGRKRQVSSRQLEALEHQQAAETHARLKAEFLERERRRAA